MNNSDFATLKAEVEKETGFHCYENTTNNQVVWYGTSDKFDAFKTKVGENIVTGSIAYLIDTQESAMYSAFTKTWY